MITLQNIYTEGKVQQLRAEIDRTSGRLVLALVPYLPVLDMGNQKEYELARDILSFMNAMYDIHRRINAPCKEEEPETCLQELSGVITSPVVISDLDKTLLNDLIRRNGLEILQLIPQRQTQEEQALQGTPVEEPENAPTPLTTTEKAWMNRKIVEYGMSILSDEQCVMYVDHPLLKGTATCTNEVELYHLVRDLAAQAPTHERITQ